MKKRKQLPYFEKNRQYIREDIAQALEKMAQEDSSIIDIIPERGFNHMKKTTSVEVKKTHPRAITGYCVDACVGLGIYASKGYGVLVHLVTKGALHARELAPYLIPKWKKYSPSPA